jgi:mRNA-degrading endonuclease RelE of RelBE toxin-antitoxin system
MTITQTVQYTRTKKKLLKKHALSQNDIDRTVELFKKDKEHLSLHYKKMICKKDKDRYAIRVLNTQYRILMTVINDEVFLLCVCTHGDYDRINKNC